MNRLSAINYKNEVISFVNKFKNGKEIIFFDLETTGTNTIASKIISCSAIKVKYDPNKYLFEEVDRMDQFINPSFHIPAEITKITGIDDDRIKDCPTEYEAYYLIKEFFGLNPLLLGYNSTNFDEKFMINLYLRAEGEKFIPEGHLDVFTMSKEKVGDLDRHTLQNVSTKLGLDKEISFHTSIDDVLATKRVFEKLLPLYYKTEDNSDKKTYKVKGFRKWSKGYRSDRVYIETIPYSDTYFDNYKKEWLSTNDDIELKEIRRISFNMANVNNEVDFVKKIKKES